jgi:hypothetical protein
MLFKQARRAIHLTVFRLLNRRPSPNGGKAFRVLKSDALWTFPDVCCRALHCVTQHEETAAKRHIEPLM